MPVVATAALVAGLLVALPTGEPTRDGERAAVAALQQVARAQRQLLDSAAIDTDGDGRGEHGYLGELAGGARLRIDPAGRLGYAILTEPLLPTELAAVQGAAAEAAGYLVQLYLPGPGGSWIRENDDGGGAGCGVDADAAERAFRAYAWPARADSGARAFCVDERGSVFAHDNADGRYLGREQPVPPHALDTDAAAWRPVR